MQAMQICKLVVGFWKEHFRCSHAYQSNIYIYHVVTIIAQLKDEQAKITS